MANRDQRPADRLAQLVQDLPPELYNEIHELVSSMSVEHNRIINKHYRPPVQLHVNHATRDAFAESFYGGRFTVHKSAAIEWARSIPTKHIHMIPAFYFAHDTSDGVTSSGPYDTLYVRRAFSPFETVFLGSMYASYRRIFERYRRIPYVAMEHSLEDAVDNSIRSPSDMDSATTFDRMMGGRKRSVMMYLGDYSGKHYHVPEHL